MVALDEAGLVEEEQEDKEVVDLMSQEEAHLGPKGDVEDLALTEVVEDLAFPEAVEDLILIEVVEGLALTGVMEELDLTEAVEDLDLTEVAEDLDSTEVAEDPALTGTTEEVVWTEAGEELDSREDVDLTEAEAAVEVAFLGPIYTRRTLQLKSPTGWRTTSRKS